MAIYLYPHSPTSSSTSLAAKQKYRSIEKDENTKPLNGSATYRELHKFVPVNLAPLSSMHLALLKGESKFVWNCIRARNDFFFIEEDVSKLVLAIKNCPKDKALIGYLIECAYPEIIDYTTNTNALIEAVKLLDEPLVRQLLEKGAKANKSTNLQLTPLNCAIRVGGLIEPIHSTSVNEQIEVNNKKLFLVVQTLLKFKAEVDITDSLGQTPLQALFNKILPQQITPSLVSLLISYGANPDAVTWEGLSALYAPAIEKAVVEGIALNQDRLAQIKVGDFSAVEGIALNQDRPAQIKVGDFSADSFHISRLLA